MLIFDHCKSNNHHRFCLHSLQSHAVSALSATAAAPTSAGGAARVDHDDDGVAVATADYDAADDGVAVGGSPVDAVKNKWYSYCRHYSPWAAINKKLKVRLQIKRGRCCYPLRRQRNSASAKGAKNSILEIPTHGQQYRASLEVLVEIPSTANAWIHPPCGGSDKESNRRA